MDIKLVKVKHVLIVDDELPALINMASELQNHHSWHLVGSCHNTQQARGMMREHQVDLLLLDIEMPGQSGCGVMIAVKTARIVLGANPQWEIEYCLVKHRSGSGSINCLCFMPQIDSQYHARSSRVRQYTW